MQFQLFKLRAIKYSGLNHFRSIFWVSHFFYPQGKSKGYHWFTNDVCTRASGPLQNVIFTGITWKTSKKPAMSQDSLLKRDVSHLHRSCDSTVKSPWNYHEPGWTPQVRDPCVIHAWSMREPPLLGVNPLFLAWTTREPHRPNFPLCTWYYAKQILATLCNSSANSQASEHLYHGPTRDWWCRAVSTYVPSVLVVKESNVLARPAVHKGFLSKKIWQNFYMLPEERPPRGNALYPNCTW